MKITNQAYETLATSGREASLFPQALSEAFMSAGLPVTIALDIQPKSDHFVANDPDDQLLVTQIEPNHPVKEREHYVPPLKHLTNVSDLQELRIGGQYGFHALNTALEFVRLYKQYYQV